MTTDNAPPSAIENTHSKVSPPPNTGERARSNVVRFGLASLIAATAASLYSPLGTAVYGPPIFPLALFAFAMVVIAAIASIAVRWNDFHSRPERWAIPLAAATSLALVASSFPDRAAFPALVFLLLPAGMIVITAFVATGADRAARCLNVFRATAAVAIALSVWGLFSWAVIDFGGRVGAVDQIAAASGLDGDYPALLSLANEHPFGHKNFIAGFALLALPLLGLLVCLDQSRARLLWLGGFPVVLVYLASAESRAGWLALAAGTVFYLGLRFLRARAGRPAWWFAPILLVVIAIPFLASPRLRESVQKVGQQESLAAIDPYRWDMFQTGIAIGNSRPLTGVGPGALSLVSAEHSVAPQYPVVYQVHSTPIQIYAEWGVAGILGGLALLWGLGQAWSGRRRKDQTPLECHLRDAAAVALIGYFAFALTDYQWDVPLIALATAVPAAAILSLGERTSGTARRVGWVTAGAVALVLLLPLFWFNGKGFLARTHLGTAVSQLYSGNVDAFSNSARRAHEWAPTDPLYLNQMANVSMTEWTRTAEPAERDRLSEQAQLELAQSLKIAPAQDSVHFNLGILLRQQGKEADALAAFQEALKYNPRKRFAWFLSGLAWLELDNEEMATEAFARELLGNPSSLFLPFWRDPAIQPHIEARNRHYERLAEELPPSPGNRYLFDWANEDPQPFAGNPDSQSPGFRVLLTALEGDPEASVTIAPLTPQALLVRAWLESDRAEYWLELAFHQTNGSQPSPDELQLIGNRLRQADTFSAALRALLQEPGLPVTTKMGVPRAAGLFERNFYGAPLYDFHIYQEPIVLLLL